MLAKGRLPVTWDREADQHREKIGKGLRGVERIKRACNERDLDALLLWALPKEDLLGKASHWRQDEENYIERFLLYISFVVCTLVI